MFRIERATKKGAEFQTSRRIIFTQVFKFNFKIVSLTRRVFPLPPSLHLSPHPPPPPPGNLCIHNDGEDGAVGNLHFLVLAFRLGFDTSNSRSGSLRVRPMVALLPLTSKLCGRCMLRILALNFILFVRYSVRAGPWPNKKDIDHVAHSCFKPQG